MLIAIEGDMGKGKTLTAVAYAVREHLASGRKIFSTTPLFNAYDCSCGMRHREDVVCEEGTKGTLYVLDHEYIDLQRFYELINHNPSELDGGLLLLDESYLFMDARMSGSKLNRMLNTFTFQTRKRQVDLFLTTHRLQRIDRRIRESIDFLIRPNHNPMTGNIVLSIRNKRGSTGRKVLDGARYYAFFDTDNVVRPQGKVYKMKQEDLE